MKNANSTAFPIFDTDGIAGVWNDGLTKREYFAAMAMQGCISHPQGNAGNWDQVAEDAVLAADALIEELSK